MNKEIFITKLPLGTNMMELVDEIVLKGGYSDRSKEEVDERLIDMGLTDIRGTYIRITIEEIE